MNLFNIFSEIEKTDPEVYERIDERRDVLKKFRGIGLRAAATALPFMLGSILKKSYGQSTSDIIGVLNFALTLEYLESEFYKKAVGTSGLIPAADLAGITSIRDHEVAHVAFLRTAIQSLGGTPVTYTAAQFDFTGHGAYPTVFSNYDTFLAVSQAFEDTGVRAYKGQAGGLMSNDNVLRAALQIHSVEARHASHIRMLRKTRGASVKPWITQNNAGGVPGVSAVYAGEENTTQAGIQITNINGLSISSDAASEAFDEPLSRNAVTSIVTPFFA